MANSFIINRFTDGLEQDNRGVVRPTYGSEALTITEGDDKRLKTAFVVKVQKDPGDGEFSDIQAAIDSITDAAQDKPYLVDIGPGIYDITATIVMKEWVYLRGERDTTILSITSGGVNPCVIGASSSGTYQLTINANSVSTMFQCYDVIDFNIVDCDLGPAARWLDMKSENTNCNVLIERLIGRQVEVAQPFFIESLNNFRCNATLLSCNASFINDLGSCFLINGDTAWARLLSCGFFALVGESNALYGARLQVGGRLLGTGVTFSNFDTALWVENFGTDNIEVELAAFVAIRSVTWDILIENPASSGFITGVFNNEKVSVNENSTVVTTGADPDNSFYVNQTEVQTKDVNTVLVRKNPGPNDFSSVEEGINAALALNPSEENSIQVDVGPGVFDENPMTIYPYITVRGVSPVDTVIRVNDMDAFLFSIHGSAGVARCGLAGGENSTGGIIMQLPSAGDAGFSDDVQYRSGYTFVKVKNNSFGFHIVSDSSIQGSSFTTGGAAFDVGDPIGINILNMLGLDAIIGGTTTPYLIKVTGQQTQCALTNMQVVLNEIGGINNAVLEVTDGAFCGVNNVTILGVPNIGLSVPNEGAAPNIQAPLWNCQFAIGNVINCEHPTAEGFVFGSYPALKIRIDSPEVSLTGNDNVDSSIGITVVGDILQGTSVDTRDNITRLVRRGSVVGLIEGGRINQTDVLEITVQEGNGFVFSETRGTVRQVFWDETILSVATFTNLFVTVDEDGTVGFTASQRSNQSSDPYEVNLLAEIIFLGRVVSDDEDILFIANEGFVMNQHGNQVEEYLKIALGAVYTSGSITTENGNTDRALDVSSGEYWYGTTDYLPDGNAPITFDTYYRDGSGGWITIDSTGVDIVPNDTWDDNSGTLAATTAGWFTKHLVMIMGQLEQAEEYFLIYAQAEYETLLEAEEGDLPTPPGFLSGSIVRISSIITQEGTDNVVQIRDERPRIGFSPSATAGSASHSELLNLASDDHPQYFLADGNRAMGGNLNMGGNDVVNAGTYNGFDLENHGSRHLPQGQDPLTTEAPTDNLNSGTSNLTGIKNSFARSDHTHAIDSNVPVTQSAGTNNELGTAFGFARADHIHQILSASAVQVSIGDSNAEGSSSSFARADHKHQIDSAAPDVPLTADTTNEEGSESTFSRSDHVHEVVVDTAVTLNPDQANSEGIQQSFTRSDHIHNIPTGIASELTPELGNSRGVSSSFSRQDHIHNIPTDVNPNVILTTSINEEGTADSFARSDHQHQLFMEGPRELNPDQGNGAGSAFGLVRSDHIHNVPTATAVSITLNQGNGQGSANTFARSDHTHDLQTANVNTVGTSNSEGSAGTVARSDHTHSHGNQTNQNHHAVVTRSLNGFMSASDKAKLDLFVFAWSSYRNSSTQRLTSTSFQNINMQTNNESFPDVYITKTNNTTWRMNFNGAIKIYYHATIDQDGQNNRGCEFTVRRNSTDLQWMKAQCSSQTNSLRNQVVTAQGIIFVSNGDTLNLRGRNTDGNQNDVLSNLAVMTIDVYGTTD